MELPPMGAFRRLCLTAATAALAALSAAEAQAQSRTLLIAAERTPDGIDGDVLKPGTLEVVVQTYEGLLRYGKMPGTDGNDVLDSSKIEGHYAESWTVADEGRTIVMKLRQGVRSPFGNELTAADVEWTFAKSFAQKRTGAFIHANFGKITSVKATGRYEVTFTLSQPSSTFFTALTHYTPGIFDTTELKKHATADDPWALKYLDTHTVGFGAYHLESLRPGEQAVYVANPNYFLGKPPFDRIVYRAVPSPANRAMLLKTGQVQWIHRLPLQMVGDLRSDPKLKVAKAVHRATQSAIMNPAFKPFDDVRVRQALNYAADKDLLNTVVFLGEGVPAASIVTPGVDGALTGAVPYPYDPARAKALLAEAGFPNGLDIELLYSDLNLWEEAFAIQLADQYKASGIRLTLKKITAADMRARGAVTRRDMPFFTSENGPVIMDMLYALYIMARSDGVTNRGAYNSPQMDALIDEATRTLDRDKRLVLTRQAQELWNRDAPWVTSVFQPFYEIMPRTVCGYVYYPDETVRWRDLRPCG